jgi:hypothetical protein
MRAYLLYIRFRLIRREVINTIVKKSYVGDWFLFYMLGTSPARSFLNGFSSQQGLPDFTWYLQHTKMVMHIPNYHQTALKYFKLP